jgi:hypothetical protein
MKHLIISLKRKKMNNYRHQATVSKNEIRFTRPNVLRSELKQYEGKNIYVSIEPEKTSSSPKQMNFYRGVILKEALACNAFGGWTKDELHDFLLYEVAGETKYIDNKEAKIPGDFEKISSNSTSFGRYIENVLYWLSGEAGVVIDNPKNYKTSNYIKDGQNK